MHLMSVGSRVRGVRYHLGSFTGVIISGPHYDYNHVKRFEVRVHPQYSRSSVLQRYRADALALMWENEPQV